MKRKVVVGQSGITAGQMKDFWRMVNDGTLDGNVFDYILTHITEIREEAFDGNFVTETRALSILGERRFLAADQVISMWNDLIKEQRANRELPLLEVASEKLIIRYTEATLRELAKDPAWYLIYDAGLSLRDIHFVLGTDCNYQPCCDPRNIGALSMCCVDGKEEMKCFEKRERSTYYAVRMEGLFPCEPPEKAWDSQESKIKDMGEEFYRAPARLIANSCIACFLLNDERHLQNCWHWGSEVGGVFSGQLAVAFFNSLGLALECWSRDNPLGNTKVCLIRKFD